MYVGRVYEKICGRNYDLDTKRNIRKGEENIMKSLDKYIGCLIGGAVGDALGYEIEFLSENDIFSRFGKKGITEYVLRNGVAEISDDTQMTLFTATGLLSATTIGETEEGYLEFINNSYKEMKTQSVQ